MAIDKEMILSFLKDNKELLKNRFNVKKIALFGSFAKGSAKNDSDIDILVDMPSSFDKFFDLKYFLEKNLERKIDLIKEKNLRLYIKDSIKDELIYV